MKNINKKYQQNKSIVKEHSVIYPEKENSSMLFIIIAFCVPVLLYLQTVTFGFTYFDDDGMIVNNIKFLSSFHNAAHAFLTDALIVKASPFYRPLQTLSYMLDIQLSGVNNTWMFHLTNILLLGVISCLLLLLLKKFLIPKTLALSGTLIYCVHPLFVSSVAWIPARGDLFLTMFSLLSFLFFIEFLQTKKTFYLLLNWIAFAIALFCKETAVILPFIFILYFILFHNKKLFETKYYFIIIFYATSGLFWFWLRTKAIGNYSSPKSEFGPMMFLSNLQTIPECLVNFFLPYDIATFPMFSVIKTLAGLLIITVITFLFLKNNERSRKEKLFCIAWFLIMMLPPMLYKTDWVDYLNHRFFIPLIGILLFVLFLFPKKWLVKSEIKISLIMVVVIFILSSCTFIRSRSYIDPLTFYNSAVNQNPKSAYACTNRGFLRSRDNDFKGALNDYNMAIAISPTNYLAYFNRACIKLYNLYDISGAITDFNKVISNNSRSAEAYCNRAVAYMNIGKTNESLNDYNKAIDITPTYEAFSNRGNVKNSMNDYNGAVEDYDKAIALDPNRAGVYVNRGIVKAKINEKVGAIVDFTRAIEIDPKFIEAYGNRAIARYNIKDFKGTIEDCNKILEFNPNDQTALEYITKAQQEFQKKTIK